MAYGLLKRILEHARDEKWIHPRDIVVDPFGGIGSTGILGAYEGYHVISVELENDFCIMGAKNYLLHCQKGWCTCGDDGRSYLRTLQKKISETSGRGREQQKEEYDKDVLFPNLLETKPKQNPQRQKQPELERWSEASSGRVHRNSSRGQAQTGTRRDYGEAAQEEVAKRGSGTSHKRESPRQSNRKPSTDDNRRTHEIPQSGGQKSKAAPSYCSACGKLIVPFPIHLQGDSRQLCQIVEKVEKVEKADCIVSSPPFCESSGAMAKPETYKGFQHVGSVKHKSNDSKAGYGQTPGQLGSMKPGKVDMVVSSPPYEGSIQTDGDGIDWSKIKEGGTNKTLARAAVGTGYGKTNGQLAEEQGDTFWQAAKEIVQQCHQILKSGGHAIWVVKSFVRKKRIVDFPGDWQRLCESVGFKTVCIHQAMLVKETTHQTLFGYTEVKRKERKSFFRRLAESKGSPRIDFEVVLCMEK